MKVDKNIYKKLKKITRPVLIEVKVIDRQWADDDIRGDRLRILAPNGKCDWLTYLSYDEEAFARSCFEEDSLNRTVQQMQIFDKDEHRDYKYKIVRVEYL